MRITVALFAHLSSFQPDGSGGRGARIFEIADETTVGEVIDMLALPDEPRVLFINGRHADDNSALTEGDRLAIFPPVAGG